MCPCPTPVATSNPPKPLSAANFTMSFNDRFRNGAVKKPIINPSHLLMRVRVQKLTATAISQQRLVLPPKS